MNISFERVGSIHYCLDAGKKQYQRVYAFGRDRFREIYHHIFHTFQISDSL